MPKAAPAEPKAVTGTAMDSALEKYIKAENEVIKKEIALREERHAAQLKAKKQRSSKSCVKKNTN